MACAAKLGYHLNIRRYVQLSEFGYCLHNVQIRDTFLLEAVHSLDFPTHELRKSRHPVVTLG